MNQADQQTDELHPELLSIGELFNGESRYTVPIYQRNYAWQVEQIEQMLHDIRDAIKDKKKSYFLGNLVVSKPHASTNYEVIDGQQRLTTLYLLLGLLGQKIHLGRLQYESRPRATAALEHIAHEDSHSATTSTAEQHREDAGIRKGHKDIDQYLKRDIKADAVEGFTEFVLEHVTVVRVTLPTSTDFNRYFEIMNTRGQQLQQVDIVKARLMAPLEGDAERACFAWIWNACADMDAYVQMTLTPKVTALRQKVFGDNWSFVKVSSFDDLLKIHETPGFRQSNENGFDKPLGLADAINEYSKMGITENLEDEGKERFRSIITFPSFLLHVLKIVQEDDAKENEGQLDDKALVKVFVNLFKDKTRDEQRATAKRFAFELLRCRNLFDSYIIKREHTGANIDEGDWSLNILFKKENKNAADYRNKYPTDKQEKGGGDTDTVTKELLMLESMLRVTYTSPRTMHWITRLLKLLVDKQQGTEILDKSILISELENYARGKIKVAFFDPDEQPKGFGIERIVFTYLDYLLWKDDRYITGEKKAKFRFTFRNSIEHFYPQNPRVDQNGNGTVSPEYLHCLGNLALLSVSDNSRFSNVLPETKATATYEQIINQSSKLMLMARIAKAQQWGDPEVCDHHKEMVKLLNDDIEKYIETQNAS